MSSTRRQAAEARTGFDNDGFADLAISAPFESIGSIVTAGVLSVIHGSARCVDEEAAGAFSWIERHGGGAPVRIRLGHPCENTTLRPGTCFRDQRDGQLGLASSLGPGG
jgi:hypothetical protein